MKKINYLWTGLIAAITLFACEDEWDKHYTQNPMEVVTGSNVEIVDVPTVDYIATATEYKEAYRIFQNNGLVKQLEQRNQSYTLLLCEDDALASAKITDTTYFINSSVSDVCMSPTDMTDGATIKMWCGKYLRVSTGTESDKTKADDVTEAQNLYISGTKVLRIIKTKDAFIYVMAKPVLAPKSLYEVFNELDDNRYSLFKELVRSYEIREFDRASSTPSGIDATGNTVYDSVFITKNTYLDRYKSGSTTVTWNMRSEAYNSTMLIPDNDVFTACMTEACDNVKHSLGREPNAADTLKFYEWMARACFYDKELEPEQLRSLPVTDPDDVTANDIHSISGYQENSTLNIAAAVWRPSVQKVDADNPIILSNGKAYYVNYMHIPNNVVIWRIKHRLYNTWNGCTPEEKEEYFRWTNAGANIGVRNINGSFGGWLWNEATQAYTWPAIQYDYLYGCPSGKAFDEKLPVSLEFTGISLNADGSVAKVLVPPGEYTLAMGWMSDKQKWNMDIYFNGELIKKGVPPTKSHYDRSGSNYPEYFDVNAMKKIDKKAGNYDRDGYAVGTVVVEGNTPQEITIKLISYDLTTAYSAPGTTTDEEGNVVSKDGKDSKKGCLLCYHWCLRPTSINY